MNAVTWNMNARPAAWNHLLDGLRPDLALLQECVEPPAATLGEGALCFGLARKEPGRRRSGSAVFIREGSLRELELPPDHHGWLIAAEVRISDTDAFTVISVHGRTDQGRVRDVLGRAFDEIQPLLDRRRVIVGGDFNMSRNWPRKSDGHTQFLDSLADRGLFECMPKFHAAEKRTIWRADSTQIYQDDHLFVSRDLAEAVTSCDVADRAGVSDHSPVVMTLAQHEA
jgi:endonuclease/exonuclease/phosphatase family metal-dependent hydrolase